MTNTFPFENYINMQPQNLREYLQYDGITNAMLEFFGVTLKNENSPNFELHYEYSDGRVKHCRPNSAMKWSSSKPQQPTVGYSIFGLAQLPENGHLLVIAAGEKDTLSLRSAGIPAICFNSETSNGNRDLIDSLKKRFKNIVIIYDADDTGFEQASKLSQQFNIAIGLLPRADYGKDVTDFLASGKTKADLMKVIEKGISKLYRTRHYYPLELLDEMRFSEEEHIIPGLLPYDSLFALVGGSDSGKSLLALQFAVSYVLKQDFLGLKVNGGKKVLYFALEDSKSSIDRRSKKLLTEVNNDDLAGIKKRIFISHVKEAISEQIEKHLLSHPDTGMVIVDTFAELSAGMDINSSGDIRSLLRPFHELSLKYEIAICFIHHIGKSSEKEGGFSKLRIVGSQAFEASMRAVFELKKNSNGHHSIAVVKGNDIGEDFKSHNTNLTLFRNSENLWLEKISCVSINTTESSQNSKVNWVEIFDTESELPTSELAVRVARVLRVAEKTACNIIAAELGPYRIAKGIYKMPKQLSAEEIKNFQL